MKFAYDKEKGISKIIRGYEILINKNNEATICITYMDNNKTTIGYSLEYEKEINKLMIDQAIKRNENILSINIDENIKRKLIEAISSVVGSLLLVGSTTMINNNKIDNIFIFGAISLGIIGIYKLHEYNLKKIEKNELEKYKIFLENRELIEQHKSNNYIYEGTTYIRDIDINSLDLYSLNDLKTIKDNLYNNIDSRQKIYQNIKSI